MIQLYDNHLSWLSLQTSSHRTINLRIIIINSCYDVPLSFRKIQRLTPKNITLNIDLKFETRLLIKLSGLTKSTECPNKTLINKDSSSAPKTSGHFCPLELKLFCEHHLLSQH